MFSQKDEPLKAPPQTLYHPQRRTNCVVKDTFSVANVFWELRHFFYKKHHHFPETIQLHFCMREASVC